ncbi:ABC transporter permease [Kineosporia sp. NBRC 101731]|uniref:ABC transporter permease n=1 Tax=Kineosporia sp. NBRC 101731 TaxID=3032199 RepID=UPI0024A417E2|nr:ABC transporter permease [Kineosporia sp. NBRC 101731]GLY31652.1 transport permease protein [Kineosporia sp. NBRC 101731]
MSAIGMTVPGSQTSVRETGADRAAPVLRRVLAQTRFDAGAMLRNGEQLLLTVVLPLFVLAGLAKSGVVDLGAGRRIDLATPGVLALALISTSFTGQAISTGFDRRAGLLRLLGTTPLGRSGLIAGRLGAVAVVSAIQVVLLGAVGLLLGWHPSLAGLLPALVVGLLGSAAFVSIGLLLAGTLRAEAVLAAANLIWVLLLAGGGVVLAPDQLGPLGDVVRWLPSGALGDGLRTTLAHGDWPWRDLLVLAAWTVAGTAATVRWFRWDS